MQNDQPETDDEIVDVASEYTECLFLNTVKTARSLTRKFDQKLAPVGVTAMQFFVMMFVRHNEGKTINAIADLMDMDRSTLTRNIDGLVRKNLVAKQMAPKGNAKVCVLTEKGDAFLDELVPMWLATRKKLQDHLKGRDIAEYRAVLSLLSTI